jgi:hypothetical protein
MEQLMLNSNFFGMLVMEQNANNSNFMGQYAGYVMHIVQISWFASWVFNNRCFNSNFIGAQLVKEATSASQSNFLGQQTGYQATNAYSSNFIGYFAGYSK